MQHDFERKPRPNRWGFFRLTTSALTQHSPPITPLWPASLAYRVERNPAAADERRTHMVETTGRYKGMSLIVRLKIGMSWRVAVTTVRRADADQWPKNEASLHAYSTT